LTAPPLTPADLLDRLERAAAVLRYRVIYRPMRGRCRAVVRRKARLIVVASEVSTPARARLLAHELCHLLGQHSAQDDRPQIEVQAEVAAALVLHSFGLDFDFAAAAYCLTHERSIARICENARAARPIAARLTKLLLAVEVGQKSQK
jgi:hypothetical protein